MLFLMVVSPRCLHPVSVLHVFAFCSPCFCFLLRGGGLSSEECCCMVPCVVPCPVPGARSGGACTVCPVAGAVSLIIQEGFWFSPRFVEVIAWGSSMYSVSCTSCLDLVSDILAAPGPFQLYSSWCCCCCCSMAVFAIMDKDPKGIDVINETWILPVVFSHSECIHTVYNSGS